MKNMKDAILVLSIYDYTEASIEFSFGGRDWYITTTFSSAKAAENQALKLAKKFGLNITKIITRYIIKKMPVILL